MVVLTTTWRGDPLEAAACSRCGNETSLSANTLDDLGIVCIDCRVVGGARGLPRSATGWTVAELVHDW